MTSEKQIVKLSTLHLRLTNEDWVETYNQLTRTELGVFFWIRTLNPFGDRDLEIDCSELGKQLRMHRTTVSRVLESLSQKNLIDLEITKAKVGLSVKPNRLTLLSDYKSESTKVENESINEQEEEKESCAPTHTDVRPRTQMCAHAQSCAPTHIDERPRTKRSPESSQGKGSDFPHTLKTNKDIKNTTNSDRSSKISSTPKPVTKSDRSSKISSTPKPVTRSDRNQEGSVLEIFEKYSKKLSLYGVYVFTIQNEISQLNPRMERIIQKSGTLNKDKVENALRAFIAWARDAKDVKDIYRALEAAISKGWEEL
ncbi:hypothetical protein HW132_31050 [Brasilonema sp. CT11]|nr:hypothetical protein [Brasilonema sp. CT11]